MRKEGSENLTFTERIESKRQRGGVEVHLRSLCELMAEWRGGERVKNATKDREL